MRILKYLGQGRYHTINNMPCQDNLFTCKTDDGRYIAAVSDGCSSSKFSDIGSKIAVSSVAEFFTIHCKEISDSDELKSDFLNYLHENLRKKAIQLAGGDMSELFATLIFAVADKGKLLVGHIGDGALLCFDEESEFFVSDPENAGASNVTYFVGSQSAYSHFHLTLIDIEKKNALRTLTLFSDGPQKKFAEIGNDSIPCGVSYMINEIREGRIPTNKALKEYLFDETITSIFDIDDDWSLIVIDTQLSDAEDEFSGAAECMTLVFYEKYLEVNPNSAPYIVPKINKLRKELFMELLPLPEEGKKPEIAEAVYDSDNQPDISETDLSETDEENASDRGSNKTIEFLAEFEQFFTKNSDNKSEENTSDKIQSSDGSDKKETKKPDIFDCIEKIDANIRNAEKKSNDEQKKAKKGKKPAPPITVIEFASDTEKQNKPPKIYTASAEMPTVSATEDTDLYSNNLFGSSDISQLFTPEADNKYDSGEFFVSGEESSKRNKKRHKNHSNKLVEWLKSRLTDGEKNEDTKKEKETRENNHFDKCEE